ALPRKSNEGSFTSVCHQFARGTSVPEAAPIRRSSPIGTRRFIPYYNLRINRASWHTSITSGSFNAFPEALGDTQVLAAKARHARPLHLYTNRNTRDSCHADRFPGSREQELQA
ncbi:unnamed protein product, partial [Scytosiphon promiscuus]